MVVTEFNSNVIQQNMTIMFLQENSILVHVITKDGVNLKTQAGRNEYEEGYRSGKERSKYCINDIACVLG